MNEKQARSRRFEVFLGGPARPFDLTVRDADTIIDAIGAYMDERRSTARAECPPEDAQDAQADSEGLAALHMLQQRLRVFCGYPRRNPRARRPTT